jgi:hypothetical protein
MDDYRFSRVEQDIGEIKHTLADQHSSLQEHMRRSNALEAQIKPMQDLMLELKAVVKLIKFIGVLAGIVECIRMFWR